MNSARSPAATSPKSAKFPDKSEDKNTWPGVVAVNQLAQSKSLGQAPAPVVARAPLRTLATKPRVAPVAMNRQAAVPKSPTAGAGRPTTAASVGTTKSQQPRGATAQPRGPNAQSRGPTAQSRGVTAQSRPGPAAAGPRDDLVACRTCNRRFAPDRVQAHEDICARTVQKKRKVFDPVKQRVKGTEAEAFLRRAPRKAAPPKDTKKPDWRRKHEEFINTIRAAKQAQAHVAAGGRLADLPPPPRSDTSDYVQCPHCGRKFNQSAAERHIPKCANYQYNKPKPTPAGQKKR